MKVIGKVNYIAVKIKIKIYIVLCTTTGFSKYRNMFVRILYRNIANFLFIFVVINLVIMSMFLRAP